MHPFGPPLYKLNESSILNESMGQSVINWEHIGELGKHACWELHLELGEYVGKVMLGTHWAHGLNNKIPKRKEFMLFV